MAIDMKKTIAEAASSLLFEKRVKKLTVKDIVEECHITRQAFYYHFEDIPDLIHWVLYQEVDVILEECMAEQDIERGIRHFFSLAAQLQPYAIRGIQSSYGDEIGRLLEQFFYDLFQDIIKGTGFIYFSKHFTSSFPRYVLHMFYYKRYRSG